MAMTWAAGKIQVFTEIAEFLHALDAT